MQLGLPICNDGVVMGWYRCFTRQLSRATGNSLASRAGHSTRQCHLTRRIHHRRHRHNFRQLRMSGEHLVIVRTYVNYLYLQLVSNRYLYCSVFRNHNRSLLSPGAGPHCGRAPEGRSVRKDGTSRRAGVARPRARLPVVSGGLHGDRPP